MFIYAENLHYIEIYLRMLFNDSASEKFKVNYLIQSHKFIETFTGVGFRANRFLFFATLKNQILPN